MVSGAVISHWLEQRAEAPNETRRPARDVVRNDPDRVAVMRPAPEPLVSIWPDRTLRNLHLRR